MIDFTSLYKKVDELVDANDFEPALTLLCDTAHRILEGGKLPISKEEIERFLTQKQILQWTGQKIVNVERFGATS